jgi:hypothetical protein
VTNERSTPELKTQPQETLDKASFTYAVFYSVDDETGTPKISSVFRLTFLVSVKWHTEL